MRAPRTLKLAAIVALTACALIAAPFSETRAQQLGGAHEFVWPREFSGDVSCRQLVNARERYLSRPRPPFNCVRGVDCPQDLAPAPPAEPNDIRVFYRSVDVRRRPIDVEVPTEAFESIRYAVERLLGDMDRVARSRSKLIEVTGYSDTTATGDLNAEVAQLIGQCVATAIDVGLQLNGYQGAYDFQVSVVPPREEDRLEGSLMNRRAQVRISY